MNPEEPGGSFEAATESNDQLIIRAKADLKEFLFSRNPDLPLDPEVERQVDTIVDIMVSIGMQKGREIALHPPVPEEPSYQDIGFPT